MYVARDQPVVSCGSLKFKIYFFDWQCKFKPIKKAVLARPCWGTRTRQCNNVSEIRNSFITSTYWPAPSEFCFPEILNVPRGEDLNGFLTSARLAHKLNCRRFKVHDLITCESKVQVVVSLGSKWVLFALGSWWVLTHGRWHVLLQSENVFELGGITTVFV